MKRIFNSVLPVVALYILACNTKSVSLNSPEAETILYDPDSTETIRLDDVVEVTKVIELKSDGYAGMIGEIRELLYTNGVFVVFDDANKLVQTFDENGNFIRRISSLGNGPHEYLDIRDVCITPNGNIAIVDTQKQRMLEFTVDGRYVSSFPFECGPTEVEYLNNDTVVFDVAAQCFSTDDRINSCEIFLADRNKNGIGYYGEDMYFKTGKSNYGMTFNQVYRFCGSVFFTLLENNTIYKLSEDGTMVPKYNLKLRPDDLVPVWDEKIHRDEDMMTWMRNYLENPFFGGAFIEFDDYTLVRYTFHYEYLPMLLYDHKKKQTFALDESGSDGMFSLFYNYTPAIMDDGHSLVCWVNPSVVRLYEEYGRSPNNELFREAIKDYTEESNPLLVVFTFK